MTSIEIGEVLGCSGRKILNFMIKNNIPRRYIEFRKNRVLARDKLGRKYCPTCKTWKPENEFAKNKNRLDGLCFACSKCRNKNLNIKRLTNRLIAIQIYSNGTMKCEHCGYDNVEALTFDHINNDGNTHRKEINNSRIEDWMKENNYPEGFRVLCRNCNWLDRIGYKI